VSQDSARPSTTRPAPAHDAHAPAGTRSVERTLLLLKALAHRGEFGWRLSDLADEVGLDRGTCHRMLACLVREGFAQRHPHDVKYYPGQAQFELGLGLPAYAAFRERAEPRMAHLAGTTRTIASFGLTSGHDTVCIFQKRDDVELPGMLIRVGTRRAMWSSVGGLAILQRLPAADAARVLAANRAQELARRGPRRLEALERMRMRSEEAGFGLTRGDLAPGIWAIAEAVCDNAGRPLGALTLAGAESDTTDRVLASVHAELKAAALDLAAEAAVCFSRPQRAAS
jgi:DNA-binding IclR family transcriptional regulator